MKHHWAIWRNTVGLLVAVASVVTGVSTALAAPLSYPNDANFYLSAPEVNLTIKADSAADGLSVNATSVVVTLSSSTGGTFTLTSPQALTVSTTGSGGVDKQSCSGGTETDTITQSSASESYTLNPTGSPCVTQSTSAAPASSPVVPVSSAYGQPYISGVGIIATSSVVSSLASSTTLTSSSSSSSSIQTELNALLTELAALQAQAGESPSAVASPPASSYLFTRSLSYGSTGTDVTELQMFLINQNAGPAARSLKAHGTTKNFASLTLAALIEFQKSAGIKPAVGYFGPITRAYVNNHIP